MPLAGVGRVLYIFFSAEKKKKTTTKNQKEQIKKNEKKTLGWARSRELITTYQVKDMSIDTLPYSGLSERFFVLREMKYYSTSGR